MEIASRLKCVALMVGKCNKMVDVGTDHGYLPIYLINNGTCEKAIASDVNLGPLNKAKMNIKKYALEDKIQCRLGGGFSVIKENEVDVAVVAGMGGNLIRDIIEEKMKVFKTFQYAVLQPVQNPEILRKYLYNSGFNIIDEELCIDEDKYYEIIKVCYAKDFVIKDDIYYEISEKLIEKKHPLLKKYIEYKINKNNTIIESITDESDKALIRKEELIVKNSNLKELLSCLLK